MLKMGDLCSNTCSEETGTPAGGLVGFHEGVDGFPAALGADLQVVSIVRKWLFAPLAPLDTRGLHLRNFFEQ